MKFQFRWNLRPNGAEDDDKGGAHGNHSDGDGKPIIVGLKKGKKKEKKMEGKGKQKKKQKEKRWVLSNFLILEWCKTFCLCLM